MPKPTITVVAEPTTERPTVQTPDETLVNGDTSLDDVFKMVDTALPGTAAKIRAGIDAEKAKARKEIEAGIKKGVETSVLLSVGACWLLFGGGRKLLGGRGRRG